MNLKSISATCRRPSRVANVKPKTENMGVPSLWYMGRNSNMMTSIGSNVRKTLKVGFFPTDSNEATTSIAAIQVTPDNRTGKNTKIEHSNVAMTLLRGSSLYRRPFPLTYMTVFKESPPMFHGKTHMS
jgi:hypothetical protein